MSGACSAQARCRAARCRGHLVGPQMPRALGTLGAVALALGSHLAVARRSAMRVAPSRHGGRRTVRAAAVRRRRARGCAAALRATNLVVRAVPAAARA
eukprot:1773425-Prymnesium_polylepis.2